MGEIEPELVEPRAHVARQHGEGAVAGQRPRRHAPPEALDRGAVRPAGRPRRLGARRQLRAGDLFEEIVDARIGIRDMAVAVDDRMIELGPYLGAPGSLRNRTCFPPAPLFARTLAPELSASPSDQPRCGRVPGSCDGIDGNAGGTGRGRSIASRSTSSSACAVSGSARHIEPRRFAEAERRGEVAARRAAPAVRFGTSTPNRVSMQAQRRGVVERVAAHVAAAAERRDHHARHAKAEADRQAVDELARRARLAASAARHDRTGRRFRRS